MKKTLTPTTQMSFAGMTRGGNDRCFESDAIPIDTTIRARFVLTVSFFSNRFNLSTDGPSWIEVAVRPWPFMQRAVRRRKAN